MMGLINDKKFACAMCIKGHRASGCEHTDRPLFEITRGRPSTQCQYCKDKRKSNNVHNTCVCGDSSISLAHSSGMIAESPRTSGSATSTEYVVQSETGKVQPTSSETFLHGSMDVHDVNVEPKGLTDFMRQSMRSAERNVQRLLNPCSCRHTGICICCKPKRPSRKTSLHSISPSSHSYSSGKRSPGGSGHTEERVGPSEAVADASYSQLCPSSPSNPGSISFPGQLDTKSFPRKLYQHQPVPDILPSGTHDPAHTVEHVHTIQRYSPYPLSAVSRHTHIELESLSRQDSAASPRTHTLSMRPPGDMSTFDAPYPPGGTIAHELPRTALDILLLDIHALDAVPSHSAHLAPSRSGSSLSHQISPVGRRRSTSTKYQLRTDSHGPSDQQAQPGTSGMIQVRKGHGSVDHTATSTSLLSTPRPSIFTTSAPTEPVEEVSLNPTFPLTSLTNPEGRSLLSQHYGEGWSAQDMWNDGNRINRHGTDDILFPANFVFAPSTSRETVPHVLESLGQHTQEILSQNLTPLLLGQDGLDSASLSLLSVGRNYESIQIQAAQNSAETSLSFPGSVLNMSNYYPSYSPSTGDSRGVPDHGFQDSSVPTARIAQISAVESSTEGSRVNPDLIDLSKPLKVEHLERIIKALQEQEEQSSFR